MAFFHRKLYQQKPKQWGPRSQVEAAVRDYFENRLGMIGPTLMLPVIEGGGNVLYNYGSNLFNPFTISSPGERMSGGLQFVSSYADTQSLFGITGYPFTLFATIVPDTGYDTAGSIIGFYRYNSILREYNIAFSSQANLTYALNAKGGGVTTAIQAAYNTVVFGKTQSIIGTFRSATDREFFIDGVSVGADNTSVSDPVTTTCTETSIGRRGGSADAAYMRGIVQALGIVPAAFNSVQAALLSAEPYAGIYPRSFPRYFPVSSSEPGTTSVPVFMNHYRQMRTT
ncbi:MAG: hypothetical protein RBT11_14270 [Desulfobacterales bacterium]|jgi:hypothetical protein|nr:hypothetical protein [Desulfobacterales bacterium]